MSRPKEHHPGAYYHIVRRCHRRELQLRPDDDLNGAIIVLTNDACQATAVQTLAACWMSNHYHTVVYDPDGRVSEWMSHVNGTMSRYCNATQGLDGHMWDAQEDNLQELGDLETVAAVAAYVICNPVAAGLVHSPSAWPGICTTLKMVASGQGPTAPRPKHFFRAKGLVSDFGEITHACPPGIAPDVFRAMVGKHLAPRLEKARAAVKASDRDFLGAEAVKTATPTDCAKSSETKNVGLAAKVFRHLLAATTEGIMTMIARYERFQADYAAARAKLVAGVPNSELIFPPGTWRLWRYYGARRRPKLAIVKAAA